MNLTLTYRQWFLLCLFGLVHIINGFIYTLQAPFYPAEAVKKNATAFEYGFVFGVYEFTVAAICPIIGSLMPHLGSKNVFYVGILLQGIALTLFGFVDKLDDLSTFLTCSILLRILEGFGLAGTFVSMYSFVPSQFPDHSPFAYGVLGMTNGFGFAMGPALGTILFNAGGFKLPFVAVGIAALVSLLIMVPTLWNTTFTNTPCPSGGGILALMKIPSVSINFFAIWSQAIMISFLFATLEEYMRELHATRNNIGLIFCGFGMLYAILSPVWGALLSWLPSPHYLILPGAVLDLVGMVLIGPLPFLGLQPSITMTCAGAIIYAVGYGALLLSSFINATREAKAHGYPDDGTTAAMLSGCYLSCFSIGAAIGPIVTGLLYDAFGFQYTEIFVAGWALLLVFILITYAVKSNCGVSSLTVREQDLTEISHLIDIKEKHDHESST